jgi:hypothetical protein
MPSVDDVPRGPGVLVRVLRVGVDGTDKEINAAEYGVAPQDGAPEMFDTIIGVCKKAGFSPGIVDGPDLMQTVLTMVNRSRASLLCLRAFGSSVPPV